MSVRLKRSKSSRRKEPASASYCWWSCAVRVKNYPKINSNSPRIILLTLNFDTFLDVFIFHVKEIVPAFKVEFVQINALRFKAVLG